MMKTIDFLFALVLAALCWLIVLPWVEAVPVSLPIQTVVWVIVTHAALTTICFNVFFPAKVLVDADRNFFGKRTRRIFAVPLGVAILAWLILDRFLPGVVIHYEPLWTVISVGFMIHFVTLCLFDPVAKKEMGGFLGEYVQGE